MSAGLRENIVILNTGSEAKFLGVVPQFVLRQLTNAGAPS
jgi:hypothetical protein